MPRLRDMLESQGLSLSEANVSDAGVHGNQAQTSEQQQNSATANAVDAEASADTEVHESVVSVNIQDGVSIYA